MARNDGFGDKQRDSDDPIPQVDGAGNGTPRKKGKKGNATRSLPSTPRKARRGGAPTPKRTPKSKPTPTPGGQTYTTTISAKSVTEISDIYTGPPAAAFTTLRSNASEPFKALLHRLKHTPKHDEQGHSGLAVPPSIVPEQDRHAEQDRSESPEQERPVSPAAAKPSPSDSGVDVLTPNANTNPLHDDDEHSSEVRATMAPVREISQPERDRLRERNQQVELVSGKPRHLSWNPREQ